MPALLPTLSAILALLVGVTTVQAQAFSGGLRFGPSVSTFRTDGPLAMTPKVGLSGGVWLDVALPGGLHLQPALTYLSAGADATARAGDVSEDLPDPEQRIAYAFRYTYLQVPLLLAYEPPLRRTFSPRVFAGPYVAFNQDAFVRVGAEGGTLGNAEGDPGVEPRDYGVAFGGLVSFDGGAYGRLAVGAEASVGLADLRGGGVETTNLGVLLFVAVVF